VGQFSNAGLHRRVPASCKAKTRTDSGKAKAT
jgi:hypothetical protein